MPAKWDEDANKKLFSAYLNLCKGGKAATHKEMSNFLGDDFSESAIKQQLASIKKFMSDEAATYNAANPPTPTTKGAGKKRKKPDAENEENDEDGDGDVESGKTKKKATVQKKKKIEDNDTDEGSQREDEAPGPKKKKAATKSSAKVTKA